MFYVAVIGGAVAVSTRYGGDDAALGIAIAWFFVCVAVTNAALRLGEQIWPVDDEQA